jgi:subtilisin family serine protease
VVAYADGASAAAAHAAIAAAGGTIVKENTQVGVATVKSTNPAFIAEAGGQDALAGAARNQPVGKLPEGAGNPRDKVEREGEGQLAGKGATSAAAGQEPLADRQWDMRMIDATPSGSYRFNQGRGVMVGIIDSGIDASHPDIAPNFNRRLSRNFVTDIPLIDGPREVPSCVDPPDTDDNGHGTHVAGLVAAAFNGLGTARGGAEGDPGQHPRRAGRRLPVPAAHGRRHGVRRPDRNRRHQHELLHRPLAVQLPRQPGRLAGGPAGAADRPGRDPAGDRLRPRPRGHPDRLSRQRAHQQEQPDHRRHQPRLPTRQRLPPRRGQLLHHRPERDRRGAGDLGARSQRQEGGLLQLGHAGDRLLSSGWFARDFFGTTQYNRVENRNLSTYPLRLLLERGEVLPDGTPNSPFVVRDCQGDTCAYYRYLQGTSMAAPHATGVAALVVAAHGKSDERHGGLTLDPRAVERILTRTATQTPCPFPSLIEYPDPDRGDPYDAQCEGRPPATTSTAAASSTLSTRSCRHTTGWFTGRRPDPGRRPDGQDRKQGVSEVPRTAG